MNKKEPKLESSEPIQKQNKTIGMAVHVPIALALLGTETGGSLGLAGYQPACRLNLRPCLKGMGGQRWKHKRVYFQSI